MDEVKDYRTRGAAIVRNLESQMSRPLQVVCSSAFLLLSPMRPKEPDEPDDKLYELDCKKKQRSILDLLSFRASPPLRTSSRFSN